MTTNPFASYGSIVTGSEFIGRHQDTAVLRSRLIRPEEPGSLAIIGQPRIGKSSLAYQTLMSDKETLIASRRVPIWLNMSGFSTPVELYVAIAQAIFGDLTSRGLGTDKLERDYLGLAEAGIPPLESFERTKFFLRTVRDLGFQVIIVLDEFDAARSVFKKDATNFQRLRDLAYVPDWKVALVTISRRPVERIEIEAAGVSTFDGILHRHTLRQFTEDDFKEYLRLLVENGLDAKDEVADCLLNLSGGHPYLSAILGFHALQSGEFNSAAVEAAARPAFVAHYERLVSYLQDDHYFDDLMTLLFGPASDANPIHVEFLLSYGLIDAATDDKYHAFSDHFHLFLARLARSVDLWPLWRETEVGIRMTIRVALNNEYGPDWPTDAVRGRSNLEVMFADANVLREKEESNFGVNSGIDLLDYMYPKDLFAIIFSHWTGSFHSIFGKDKQYWDQRAQLLGRLRTPLAHNRLAIVTDYEKQIAEGYCKEILATLS